MCLSFSLSFHPLSSCLPPCPPPLSCTHTHTHSLSHSLALFHLAHAQEFSVQRIGFKERVSTLREAEKALAYAVATMRSVSNLSDGTSPAFP